MTGTKVLDNCIKRIAATIIKIFLQAFLEKSLISILNWNFSNHNLIIEYNLTTKNQTFEKYKKIFKIDPSIRS